MKQPKKLTRVQKKFLTQKQNMIAIYILFIKEDKTSYIFLNKKTNEQLRVEKN